MFSIPRQTRGNNTARFSDELNHPHYAPTPSRPRRRCTVTIDETIPPVVAATDCVNPAYRGVVQGRKELTPEASPARRSERDPGVMERLVAARAAVRDGAVWDALTTEEQAANGAVLLEDSLSWNRLSIFQKARAASHFAAWQPHKDSDGIATAYTLVSPHKNRDGKQETYWLEFSPAICGMECDYPAGSIGNTCYHVIMFPKAWLDEMMGELTHLALTGMEQTEAGNRAGWDAFEALQYGDREPMRALMSAADWG